MAEDNLKRALRSQTWEVFHALKLIRGEGRFGPQVGVSLLSGSVVLLRV